MTDKSAAAGDSGADGRRSFLRKGAIAAGAAWAVPLVTSTRAMAQGTCTDATLVWTDHYPIGTSPTAATVNGITLTQTYSSTGTAPSANSNQINGGTSGNRSPYLRLAWGGAAVLSTQTILFSFSSTVRDVTLTLTDIDATTNSWQDQVLISATGPGAQVIGSTFVGPNVLGTNPWDGNPATGNAGSGTTDGNVDVVITGLVDTFTMVYTALPPFPAASQHIGIFNPGWCA